MSVSFEKILSQVKSGEIKKGMEKGEFFTFDKEKGNFVWWNPIELANSMKKNRKVWCWGAEFGEKMVVGKISKEYINEFNVDYWSLKVNANRLSGNVIIALHGSDTFTVFLTENNVIKKRFNLVYCDMLVDIIDKEIEFVPDYNY